ncbi:MAG: sulfatase [Planctomycetes bacterium]|nr:sulfatase [Planctomycetota bacterium]
MPKPNLVFVFADQMRAEATGFGGNAAVHTPYLDRLAQQSFHFPNCISGTPVCTPWRACLLTGQYPLAHGLYLNDVRLPTDRPTFGTVLKEAGYHTGYIGKWHLDGPKRKAFTPPGPRRQGFDFWAVANCSHEYMHSIYYHDQPVPEYWPGYDAEMQTAEALAFMKRQGKDPFALFLSWGPPHNPYRQVPQPFLDLYPRNQVPVRKNCPEPNLDDLQGYYAHVSALDEQVGRLLQGLQHNGQLDNTFFVFTSDHGDMLGSHGMQRKQLPWEESINVPFLLRTPRGDAKRVPALLNGWDLMPTLLMLMGVKVPSTVQGLDLSGAVTGKRHEAPSSTLACAIATFSEYCGQPWRAVRTERYTYVENLDGPWLLYDNPRDPFQQRNLVNLIEHAPAQAYLKGELQKHLRRFGDEFKPAEYYHKRFGYQVGKDGAIPIDNSLPAAATGQN